MIQSWAGAVYQTGHLAKAWSILPPILTSRRRAKVLRWHHDVPRKPDQFEQADEEPSDVEFPPPPTMAGRTGISVMIIVPALAGSEYPDDDVVLAVLLR
jgi:hypothetical protein